MSNFINLHEIICSYAAKNYKKLKQLVYTAVFNASYIYFVQNQQHGILISIF
jgi:hypothetical protein